MRRIACSNFHLLHHRVIEAKNPWPENSTFACWWQTIEGQGTLVRGGGRAGKHLQPPLVPFRLLHGAQGRSAGDFLTTVPRDLATHLRITTGFTIPFDLKEHFSFTQLLVRTAQQTHRLVPPAAQDDLGEGVVLGPCATGLGFTTGLWLAAARAEMVMRWTATQCGTGSRP